MTRPASSSWSKPISIWAELKSEQLPLFQDAQKEETRQWDGPMYSSMGFLSARLLQHRLHSAAVRHGNVPIVRQHGRFTIRLNSKMSKIIYLQTSFFQFYFTFGKRCCDRAATNVLRPRLKGENTGKSAQNHIHLARTHLTHLCCTWLNIYLTRLNGHFRRIECALRRPSRLTQPLRKLLPLPSLIDGRSREVEAIW